MTGQFKMMVNGRYITSTCDDWGRMAALLMGIGGDHRFFDFVPARTGTLCAMRLIMLVQRFRH